MKKYNVISSATQGIVAKLAHRYAGPCKITEVLGSNTYELTNRGDNTVSPIHAEQIKVYVPEDVEDEDEEASASQPRRKRRSWGRETFYWQQCAGTCEY